MIPKPFVACGVTLVCAAALTACGSATGQTSSQARATHAQAASSSQAAGSTSTAAPTPAQTLAHRSVSKGEAELEVYDLYRHGKLVTLEFGLRSTGEEPISANYLLSPNYATDDVSGVYLVDGQNKKKYLPARAGDECICSSRLHQHGVGAGHTQYLYATYGAPEDGVRSVDITFPHFGTLKDIKIS